MADSDDLKEARDDWRMAQDAESDNRTSYEDDIEFALHEKQWPAKVEKAREDSNRPCLTISKMKAFIRQVVNDARQNKPSIKVHPADSGADPETAEVINGLIRNIEYTSNADVAYDTAMETAVAGGFGYWRVGLDYAYHDSFDMDLTIERVANPLSIYGDPYSTAADSSDWMRAFAVDLMSKAAFQAKYGKDSKTITDWDDTTWANEGWRVGNDVLVAERWKRVEAEVKVSQFRNLANGEMQTYSDEDLAASEDLQALLATGLLEFKRSRMAKTYRVTQQFMTGAEILGETVKWAGCYIPIVPVYGDEYNIKGKRHFRSLIHSAKDAQRQFNYWRTAATELVALAPKTPWIGRKGTFDSDQERWQTANTESHAYLEYDGEAPVRIPLDSGPAAGALQEALNASDDMKAVIGLYDASLGARSNETSGRAIMARQREGDVSTFHFTDNLNRAIRHTGRILIDLIPSVYSGERIIRVMGEDGSPENKPLNQEYQKTDPKTGRPMQDESGNPIMAMHDLSAGKYDLTVTSGPSFTTRREEAAFQMTEMMRALPASAPILGKHLAKNLDWPGADDIAEELEAMGKPQIPPELQQQIEEGQQKLAEQEQTIQQMKADNTADREKTEGQLALQKQKQEAELQMQRERMEAEFALEMQKIKQARNLKLVEMGMEENAPEEGEDGVLKSKDETRSEALMQGLTYLAQLVAQEGQSTRASLEQIAAAVVAPTELIKDQNGKTVGARKVMN